MPEETLKTRSPYWDNAKGLLIFLVVFGHYLYAYSGGDTHSPADYIVKTIYVFHMPAFIFVSGFLSKSAVKTKPILKLVFAYVIFNFSMMFAAFVFSGTAPMLLTPYYSYWYILALIIWRLCASTLGRIKGIVLIGFAAALLVGFWPEFSNVLAIGRTVAFFPFFMLGYTFDREKADRFISSRKPLPRAVGAVLLAVMVFVSARLVSLFDISNSMLLMANYESATEVFIRLLLFVSAGLFIVAIGLVLPSVKIPLLTKWGENSLAIYLFHRAFTLVFAKLFPASGYNNTYVLIGLTVSVATMLLLGNDAVSRALHFVLDKITDKFYPESKAVGLKIHIARSGIALALTGILLITPAQSALSKRKNADDNTVAAAGRVHPVLSAGQKALIDEAVEVAFVGDLILLKDQIIKAYDGKTGLYNFERMFEFTKDLLSEPDFTVGIFEGPMAGEEAGYSSSDLYDGEPVYLNYPDSFANAVKSTGIDLVSTANNHLLDKGTQGALRTLDILDRSGLLHTGSYRNASEKGKALICEIKGLRIAFLAYTYGSNYYKTDYFLNENPSITSVLCPPESEYYEKTKAEVERDFKRAKDKNPDLIVVMPHMGTQFAHETDDYQDAWNDVFIEAGAGLVLGDHSHAVQPIEFRKDKNGKNALIVNCPGNFVNSYVDNNGDATSIVKFYLDSDSGEPLATGVIPMWTHSTVDGLCRALPVYKILNNKSLKGQISVNDMKRINEVHGLVTSVMLGEKLSTDQAQEVYFLFPDGYVRQKSSPIPITEHRRKSPIYKMLIRSKTVCFVGDSITAGSENGGYGWYEPLTEAIEGIEVSREAWGGATTMTLLRNSQAIASHQADAYIIAIGTTDVRYRDNKNCAMDSKEYINNIGKLVNIIETSNPKAEIAFIAPWTALKNDPFSKLKTHDRDKLLEEYGQALEKFCNEKGYLFIDPNTKIRDTLLKLAATDILIDHIHPNASLGIQLYSESVIDY